MQGGMHQNAACDQKVVFLSWVTNIRPGWQLMILRCAAIDGHIAIFETMLINDMAYLNILLGHGRLLVDTLKDLEA